MIQLSELTFNSAATKDALSLSLSLLEGKLRTSSMIELGVLYCVICQLSFIPKQHQIKFQEYCMTEGIPMVNSRMAVGIFLEDLESTTAC